MEIPSLHFIITTSLYDYTEESKNEDKIDKKILITNFAECPKELYDYTSFSCLLTAKHRAASL